MAKLFSPKTAVGIGELYGQNLITSPMEVRATLAAEALAHKKTAETLKNCPFQKDSRKCTKKGGVCSTRVYSLGGNGEAILVPGSAGAIRPACPHRMNERQFFQNLASRLVLGVESPIIVPEVSLKRVGADYEGVKCNDVGRLDFVLIDPDSMDRKQKSWVALEMQSSYFSGQSMGEEFIALRDCPRIQLPYPVGKRRTDDKSSFKRLFAQIQEKVPVLRTWGKKMVIVVDQPFLQSLGNIKTVRDMSNADIVWMVAGFGVVADGGLEIDCQSVFYSTLEQAVEILSGGEPIPKDDFEAILFERAAALTI